MNYIEKEKQSYKTRYYINFGNKILNENKLDQNKLIIKYKNSHGGVPNIPQTVISNKLKEFIFNLIHTGSLDIETQKMLDQTDTEILERLLKKCDLTIHLGYKKIKMTHKDLQEKYSLLKGSLLSGNNSVIPELIGMSNERISTKEENIQEIINELVYFI